MSDYIVDNSSLALVADAIRTKCGLTKLLNFPTDYINAINSIEDITEVVSEQITLINIILTNLDITVDESTGSNKEKLMINNTNLNKIIDRQVIEDAIILPYLNTTY